MSALTPSPGTRVLVREFGKARPTLGEVTGVMERTPHLVRVRLDDGTELYTDELRVTVVREETIECRI